MSVRVCTIASSKGDGKQEEKKEKRTRLDLKLVFAFLLPVLHMRAYFGFSFFFLNDFLPMRPRAQEEMLQIVSGQ